VNPLADRGRHWRQRWFECACCPPNIARLIAYVPGMVYARGRGSVYVNLYAASRAWIELDGGRVQLIQRTRYPWDGLVEVEVRPEGVDEFSLLLRAPLQIACRGRGAGRLANLRAVGAPSASLGLRRSSWAAAP